MKYLLDVTFCAGSDEPADVDRKLYVIDTVVEMTNPKWAQLFYEANKNCDPFNEDRPENFPSYEEGLNVDTLMDGVAKQLSEQLKRPVIYFEVKKGTEIPACEYMKIEQWQ